jgi:hypothetical protein
MNKYKQLTKKIAKTGIGAAIAIGVCLAFYVGISMYAESVVKQKTEVEQKVTSDDGMLKSMKDQMDKSGEAEKRYASLQEKRSTQVYYSSLEEFYNLLRQMNGRYQIDKPKVGKNTKEMLSSKQELAHFNNYDVMERPLSFTFDAISDLHVFSLIEEMRASAPGMIRIDGLTLKRTTDMIETSYTNLSAGSSPLLVDAKLEITWITIVPKEKKEEAEGAAAKANVSASAP